MIVKLFQTATCELCRPDTYVFARSVLGMAKMEGGVKILLDIGKVLSAEEVVALEKVA